MVHELPTDKLETMMYFAMKPIRISGSCLSVLSG